MNPSLSPRAMHIEHFEDLIFVYGGQGLSLCSQIVNSISGGSGNLSLKMDGKPAVVFGRNKDGLFVLTDKSAFMAKTYDGVATSFDHLKGIMMSRRGDRTELIAMYKTLWGLLEAATPRDYRGFVQADLLWCDDLGETQTHYRFTPNVVEYSVSKKSEIGKKIGNKRAGLVVHSYYANNKTHPQPVGSDVFRDTHSVVFFNPKINVENINVGGDISGLVRYSSFVDRLLDPGVLRSLNISVLPDLLKKWINHNVRVGSFTGLTTDFEQWLGYENLPHNKKTKILEYYNRNKPHFSALFKIFVILYDKKVKILNSLNRINTGIEAKVGQQPSHEGFVFAENGIYVKFVDRFLFSKTNFFRNN